MRSEIAVTRWPHLCHRAAPDPKLGAFVSITEASAENGEEYGEERLVDALEGIPVSSLEDLHSHLFSSVKQFCNSRLSDDATLLMVAAPAAGAEQWMVSANRKLHVLEHVGVRS